MTFFSEDDDEVAPDARDVLAASAVLQITEFELFGLAYARWFGEGAHTRQLEPHFVLYMFGGSVPHWVRQYCRAVLDDDQAGRLDPASFGVHPVQESNTMVARGIRYAVALALAMVTIHLVAILVSGP